MWIEGEDGAQVEDEAAAVVPPDADTGAAQTPAPDDEADEVDVVTIGTEAAPASDENAPTWVRDLRKRTRELERENAELRKGTQPKPIEVGKEPDIEDFDFNTDEFKAAWRSWNERKQAVDRQRTEAEQAQIKAQDAWNAELATYGNQKQSLKVPDFADAEDEVTATLSPEQQAIIVSGAENKALLIYAIGRNPDRMRELAAIKDPVKFAFAAARLEKDLKVEKRRASTSPENVVTGSARTGGTSDAKLERLEAEAERTGDRSKVIAHKRSLKKA